MNLEYNLDKKIKNCVMNHPGSWMEPSDIAEWISKKYPKECEEIRQERGIDCTAPQLSSGKSERI